MLSAILRPCNCLEYGHLRGSKPRRRKLWWSGRLQKPFLFTERPEREREREEMARSEERKMVEDEYLRRGREGRVGPTTDKRFGGRNYIE